MGDYCDVSRVKVVKTTKEVVYSMVTKKHYAKKWSASNQVYAVYWDDGESEFFEDRKLKLIGVALIGYTGLLFTAFLYYIAIAGLIKVIF